MLKKTIVGASVAVAMLLTGCQSTTTTSLNPVSPLNIIAQESQKAVIAQQSLKTAQSAQLRELQVKQARFNVDVLNVNYIGTPQVLLNSVATHFGYRYLEAGPERALSVVNFTNRKVTANELVKDVGVFVNGQANIVIDHQNKTIVLQTLPR